LRHVSVSIVSILLKLFHEENYFFPNLPLIRLSLKIGVFRLSSFEKL